jgi:hypothetical protein
VHPLFKPKVRDSIPLLNFILYLYLQYYSFAFPYFSCHVIGGGGGGGGGGSC